MKICTKCGTQLNDNDTFCTECGEKLSQIETQEKTNNSTINKEKSYYNTIADKLNKAYMCPIIIGIILILVGLFIQVPGGALTTYESLDGNKTEHYAFDDKYSSIDEYVGGDAYNYIIGASLVAGKISGIMTTKAVFIVGGALCLCLGITLMMLPKEKTTNTKHSNETKEENL